MNPHIGSSLNDFLAEEGMLEESELVAVKRVLAQQVEKAMKDKCLNKTQMAQQMGTSRAALNRLLDPFNTSITLHTLERAAHAVGKRIHLAIMNYPSYQAVVES
jgi:antitoxin HicB